MKKVLVLSLLGMTMLFGGCKKKSDDPTPVVVTPNPNPANKSKTQLLTQHAWKLASSTADKEVDVDGDNSKSTNVMVQRNACENDDILTFSNSDGSPKTGSKDQGATKCSTSDPQSVTFNWRWNDSETVLKTTAFWGFINDEYTVLDLGENVLKITYGAKDKNDQEYIATDVYVKP